MFKRARGGLERHRSVLALEPADLPSREAVKVSQHFPGQKDLTAPSPVCGWLLAEFRGFRGGLEVSVVLVVQFLGNKTTLPFDLSCDSGQRLLGTLPFCCECSHSARFCAASVASSLGSEWEARGFRAQTPTLVLADARGVQNLAQILTPQIIASPPLSVNEAGE